MNMPLKTTLATAAMAAVMLTSVPVQAAPCGNDASGFNAWRTAFIKEASAAGFSGGTLSVLKNVTYDKNVIRLDRNQAHPPHVSFASYSARRVTKGRINKARSQIKKFNRLFVSIEKRYGVPAPVLTAIWALETDFGANQGKMSAIRSLATLAYDCRRKEFFKNELNAALSIIQRGYMDPSRLKGAWAGELGQTQFLASSYLKYAVDFDGNGRRDLIGSTADAMASTANYLKSFGWKRGGAYGPGSANARVFAKWNSSNQYQKVIALLASKIGQ